MAIFYVPVPYCLNVIHSINVKKSIELLTRANKNGEHSLLVFSDLRMAKEAVSNFTVRFNEYSSTSFWETAPGNARLASNYRDNIAGRVILEIDFPNIYDFEKCFTFSNAPIEAEARKNNSKLIYAAIAQIKSVTLCYFDRTETEFTFFESDLQTLFGVDKEGSIICVGRVLQELRIRADKYSKQQILEHFIAYDKGTITVYDLFENLLDTLSTMAPEDLQAAGFAGIKQVFSSVDLKLQRLTPKAIENTNTQLQPCEETTVGEFTLISSFHN